MGVTESAYVLTHRATSILAHDEPRATHYF